MRRIPLVKPDLPNYDELAPAFAQILASGRLTNFGPWAQAFEQQAAARLGGQAVSMASGTTALVLTLQALGIGPGCRVALPSYTFTATAQAVAFLGARPVFVDVDDTLTLSSSALQQALHADAGINAVIAVHVHGHPCDVHRLQRVVAEAALQRGRHLPLVYDAAHAFGAAVGEQPVGSFGDAEVFSLSVTKALVCGEGGLVTTSSPDLAERLKAMRNYGVASRYDATLPGLNGKFSELHAAIGCHNLPRLDAVLATRAYKAVVYRSLLEQACEVYFPRLAQGVSHTWKDFNVLLPPALAPQRDRIVEALKCRGVETRAYFSPAVHQQSLFSRFASAELPVTEDASARVLTLPFYTDIDEVDMGWVAKSLAAVF